MTSSAESVPYQRAIISNHKNTLKSREYDTDMLVQMSKRLNAIAFSMGFRESMSPEELLVLSQWIKEQFGDVSMQEVAHGFDLVTAKKIGDKIQHYATFSKQYIGEVLNAFKIHRAKQIKLFEEHMKVKAIEENRSVGATPQEMYEGIKKIALETGQIMKAANWTDAYNHAWSKNLIPRMSEKERSEYKEATIKALESEKRGGILLDTFNINASIQSECHKRIMQIHFQEFINKKSNNK